MDPHRLASRLATLLVATAAVAHAATPGVVATPTSEGHALGQQRVPATAAFGLAQSRTIYLAHDGVALRPGGNDAIAGTSTIVSHPVEIPPWVTPPEVWSDTVACVSEIFSRFAVTVTDVDPGDAPHIEAVFGGSPLLLDLARTIDGISPFTDDCAIVEGSIVFAFTDILRKDDARSACLIIAHEIGHSYGLDHQLLDSDPMTTTHGPGGREFADQDAACGEGAARPCGLDGSTCRASQNTYQLLTERLGLAGAAPPPPAALAAVDPAVVGGCAATGHGSWGGLVVAWLVARRLVRRAR